MTQAIFLASGNTIEEALSFAASLIGNILIGQKELPASDRVDVFCDDIQDANKLDNILWEKPKFAIISHQLVTENTEGIVRIGYPGTKFGLEADCLINISPDLPRDLDTYQFYYQLVIMDGDKLRERAAETWAQCKKLGLDTTFCESL